MATIYDLNPSITELSNDEALKLIISIRNNRRVKAAPRKIPAKVARQRESKKNPKQQDIFKLLQTMSDKDAEKLLNKLHSSTRKLNLDK
jgi:hypothetical protein